MAGAGTKLRAAIAAEKPLQVVGTINAYTAIMAESVGFKAIYLSGAGVANASYGLPDLETKWQFHHRATVASSLTVSR